LTGKPFTGVAGSIQIFICIAVTLMSACGYKQTFSRPKSTSALPPKGDILVASADFRD